MKSYIIIIISAVIFSSCDLVSFDNGNGSQALVDKDREFSDFSQKYGMKKAFIEYADSAAVLLKPDMMPIKGSLSIRNYYKYFNDENMKLSWVPLDGVMAKSRDLGYTYGIWELSTSDSTMQGTYITVWKKDENGQWKYVLDSGNEGLGIRNQEED